MTLGLLSIVALATSAFGTVGAFWSVLPQSAIVLIVATAIGGAILVAHLRGLRDEAARLEAGDRRKPE